MYVCVTNFIFISCIISMRLDCVHILYSSIFYLLAWACYFNRDTLFFSYSRRAAYTTASSSTSTLITDWWSYSLSFRPRNRRMTGSLEKWPLLNRLRNRLSNRLRNRLPNRLHKRLNNCLHNHLCNHQRKHLFDMTVIEMYIADAIELCSSVH